MRVAVIGSTSLTLDVAKFMPDGMTALLSGGSTGIEQNAEKYADERNMQKLILKKNYYKCYGKQARLISYENIIEECDYLIVIWDGKTRDTKYAIGYANEIGKPLNIHTILPD